MHKLLLAAFALTLIFAACKKSNSSNPAPVGISCDINGKATTFNGSISVDTTGGTVAVIASEDSTIEFPALEFVIGPVGPLTTGIYPAENLAPLQSYSVLSYVAPPTTQFANTDAFVSADDTIDVTSVTSTTISGTFHGTALFQYFDPISTNTVDSTITITNGVFTIKL
jgi:hypothetical protein